MKNKSFRENPPIKIYNGFLAMNPKEINFHVTNFH